MYSQPVRKALEQKKIEAGDRLRVVKEGTTYEGMLMPRIELGDANCIVLKLDNGYNIGVRFADGVTVERIAAGKKEERPAPVLKFDKGKPPISLITSGGTVASRVDYKTGGVIALMTPDELLSVAPELANFVNLRDIVQPFNKMSEDMNHEDWQELAGAVAKQLNHDNGVILTHGTDALHYTSAALSFMLKNLGKPVVLVGSQRSSDRGSTDAAMNLVCAAYLAGYSDFAEVGICMHATSSDDYCFFTRGTKVRKMDKSRRDAFRPVNDLPLAKVWPEGKIEALNPQYRKRSDEKVLADTAFEPKVALLRTYPGSDPKMLEFLLDDGYKGVVLEAMGLGHVPTQAKLSWIPAIRRAVKVGVPVVVTSQAPYGRINTDVYTNLRILFRETGALSGQDMTPETAYVKLGWVLGHTTEPAEIKRLMATNIAGEISARILPETFLY